MRWSTFALGLAGYGCFGLGYIAVQISFIQRFTMFLGHPVYAVSVVLLAFLVPSLQDQWDRHETRIHATDLSTGEQRPFRLDRIEKAEVIDAVSNPTPEDE